MFVVLVLVQLAPTISAWVNPHSLEPPHHARVEDIIETVEYQIALNPKEDWADRAGMMAKWVKAMNKHNSLIRFDMKDAIDDSYSEHNIQAAGESRCGTPQNMMTRYRHFKRDGRVEFTIKRDEGDTKKRVCAQPLWPSAKFYNISSQKCEEDVHPCFTKFSRATTVVFPSPPSIKICKHLVDLFPNAFPEISELDTFGNKVTTNVDLYWWRVLWKGDVGTQMSYQVTFTASYSLSQAHAVAGDRKITQGEMSLRFSSKDNGPWERYVVHQLQTMVYRLILDFDTYEEHKECAQRYLKGEDLDHLGYDEKQHLNVLK